MTDQELKKQIHEVLDSKIDETFNIIHQVVAETKSGDITPEQDLKLKFLKSELEDLIFNQVKQNL